MRFPAMASYISRMFCLMKTKFQVKLDHEKEHSNVNFDKIWADFELMNSDHSKRVFELKWNDDPAQHDYVESLLTKQMGFSDLVFLGKGMYGQVYGIQAPKAKESRICNTQELACKVYTIGNKNNRVYNNVE